MACVSSLQQTGIERRLRASVQDVVEHQPEPADAG
jgi:hypothetical protein